MRPLPLKTAAILIAVTGLMSSACVKAKPPGVGLVKVDTNAVFGIDKKSETPAGFAPEVDLGSSASEIPLADLPTFNLVSRGPDKTNLSNEKCPIADTRKVFPKESATVTVRGLPAEGAYQWKKDLLVSKTQVNGKAVVRAVQAQLETRLLRRVQRTSGNDHQFTFETIAPSLSGSTFDVTSFTVNTNPALVVKQRVESRTVGVVPVEGADVVVPPPNDAPGIFINKIETQDAKGVRVGGFTPLRPMLILPLEEGIVHPGGTFSSLGIDASSGDVLYNSGLVNATSRIDACGEVVEGFTVTLNQTLASDFSDPTTSPDGFVTDLDIYGARNKTRTLDYTFATQYGAAPIAVTLAVGDLQIDDTAFYGRWTLGGLTPAKLPDSAK